MKLDQHNTALLVFSLSAEREISRKSIFDRGNRKAHVAFFNVLIEQTRKLASESGIDIFWIDEHEQTGNDFSTRFTNAFQKLFDAGYDNVVSIGNDSPDLTIQLLQEAIHKLGSKKMVIGPSNDGGIYLFGLNKEFFDKRELQGLPWQTSFLFNGLQDYINAQKIDAEILQELKDIDTLEDMVDYAVSNPTTILSKFFMAIKATMKSVWDTANDLAPSLLKPLYVGLRAPPVM
ncbi:TIGR04282 family arsenosugar biosynthesis glycosyltransferase [Flagellimonas lutimaris]|uniref:TIGR04282 family arsenosugar biosynthesis glycosyltransferase n=1 Tax=Flagellimonas lutimaris TaxID=475082 RepID=UPI003F5CBEC3